MTPIVKKNRRTKLGTEMTAKHATTPNPRCLAARRANWSKRRGFTAEGLQRLRESALKHRPWESSTGPRTIEGKIKVANNGRKRQVGPVSIRQLKAELAVVQAEVRELAAMRLALFGGQAADQPALEHQDSAE
jgi:hypothetical protein